METEKNRKNEIINKLLQDNQEKLAIINTLSKMFEVQRVSEKILLIALTISLMVNLYLILT